MTDTPELRDRYVSAGRKNLTERGALEHVAKGGGVDVSWHPSRLLADLATWGLVQIVEERSITRGYERTWALTAEGEKRLALLAARSSERGGE